MANKYPYVPSAGPLVRTIEHLRRSFPKEVNADTLRKLGVAPSNESYVINVLRFLGAIDEEGKQVAANTKAFLQHQPEAFAAQFAVLVKNAYEELFELHGEDAWVLDRANLTQFFRTTDHSTDVVGGRQAGTFLTLAGLSGKAQMPTRKEATGARASKGAAKSKAAEKPKRRSPSTTAIRTDQGAVGDMRQVGLTVRIEVNLPAEGDQETYDRIFRSLRKNLIDGD